MLARTKHLLPEWADDAFTVREVPGDQGPGIILMLEARYAGSQGDMGGFWPIWCAGRTLGQDVGIRMAGYIRATAFAGPYLADRLNLALRSGWGRFVHDRETQPASIDGDRYRPALYRAPYRASAAGWRRAFAGSGLIRPLRKTDVLFVTFIQYPL